MFSTGKGFDGLSVSDNGFQNMFFTGQLDIQRTATELVTARKRFVTFISIYFLTQ